MFRPAISNPYHVGGAVVLNPLWYESQEDGSVMFRKGILAECGADEHTLHRVTFEGYYLVFPDSEEIRVLSGSVYIQYSALLKLSFTRTRGVWLRSTKTRQGHPWSSETRSLFTYEELLFDPAQLFHQYRLNLPS